LVEEMTYDDSPGCTFLPRNTARLCAPAFQEEPRCKTCKVAFTWNFWRHHCRECGASICDACTAEWTCLPHYGHHMPVRVCSTCRPDLKKREELARGGLGLRESKASGNRVRWSQVLESCDDSSPGSSSTAGSWGDGESTSSVKCTGQQCPASNLLHEAAFAPCDWKTDDMEAAGAEPPGSQADHPLPPREAVPGCAASSASPASILDLPKKKPPSDPELRKVVGKASFTELFQKAVQVQDDDQRVQQNSAPS